MMDSRWQTIRASFFQTHKRVYLFPTSRALINERKKGGPGQREKGASKDCKQIMTRHFSLEEWLDYANRNVSSGKRSFMMHHLESGCSHCAQVASHWQALKQFAAKESSLRLPDQAVAMAKQAFRAPAKPAPRPFFETIAQLVFDSFQQPVLAGVRSSVPGARSLLYEAGQLLIDLNLDFSEDTRQVVLQGQVMDSKIEGKGIEEIPVSLQSGRETLAQTQTNEFGEFELQCDARRGLQVSVAVNPRRNVLIVLDDTIWAQSSLTTN